MISENKIKLIFYFHSKACNYLEKKVKFLILERKILRNFRKKFFESLEQKIARIHYHQCINPFVNIVFQLKL